MKKKEKSVEKKVVKKKEKELEKEKDSLEKQEKESKKKVKRKPKKIVIIITILIIILLGISVGLYLYKYFNDKLIDDIKSHYNQYVITTKETSLYDKHNNIVGTISKDFNLELKKNKDAKNKYFNIKDTSYYIYYQDVKKIKKYSKEQLNTNYLPLNKNIKTTKKITLMKNNKKVLELEKGIELPISYIKDNNYIVYYLDQILQVKKDKQIKEIDKKNTEEIGANNISVIYYETINDNCNNYNCLKPDNVKEQANKLKENGYYSITMDEYKDFLNGYLNLKNKAILYTTSNQNDYINNINNELRIHIELINDATGLKFNATNKTSNKNSNKDAIDCYQIKSYSTIDNILKMANGEEVKESAPVVRNQSGQGIAVLNYHFFYDPNLGESCNEGICLTVQKFEEHLAYLKNNGYKTLTISEFRKWMFNEIELPEKSVLITVDDGAMGTGKHNGNKLIPLLEKYNLHATLFLITGWWDLSNYISPNLDVQSHTNDMHQYGTCGNGQINCYSYDQALADLKQSINILGNTESFCFPFYSYSDRSLQVVKDAGFKIAFVGGNRKATRNNNKYLIPRYPIHSNITMQRFIDIIS